VKRVYLLHRFQGSGLGRRLMNEALAHARASGARRILLGVYGKNDDAIAFYERIGYSKIGTRMFRVGSTLHDDLILGRPVD
jgi:ribosomal protein S18 acetylase RimI-like enzyme